jgi:hypothetical protein
MDRNEIIKAIIISIIILLFGLLISSVGEVKDDGLDKKYLDYYN